MDTGWRYDRALEIAEEAGLGEEYIARARFEMQNPVKKLVLKATKKVKGILGSE